MIRKDGVVRDGLAQGCRREFSMKKMAVWMVAGLAVAVALCGCGKKKAELVTPGAGTDANEVVLRIDDAEFTRAQIIGDLAKFERQFPEGASGEELNRMRNAAMARVLDSLITRQLVKAEMERQGATITQDEVNDAKKNLFGHLQNEDAMAIMLAENNMTMEQLEDSLKLDIFRNKLLADQVAAATNAVTEETAREFYDGHLALFTRPAGRDVSHILVRVGRDASEEEKAAARKKIEGVREALLSGADFAQLARETSDCLSAPRGGELGVIPRGREAPEFEEAVYSQEIGAIGEVVESPVGLHIIKVNAEVEEEVAPFDVVKDQIVMRLRSAEHRRIGAEYVQQLREKADIKFMGSLAILNPQEPGAEDAEDEQSEEEAGAGDMDMTIAEEALAAGADAAPEAAPAE